MTSRTTMTIRMLPMPDAPMTEAIAVAAETATEAAEQKDDEDNDKDESERHDLISLAASDEASGLARRSSHKAPDRRC